MLMDKSPGQSKVACKKLSKTLKYYSTRDLGGGGYHDTHNTCSLKDNMKDFSIEITTVTAQN